MSHAEAEDKSHDEGTSNFNSHGTSRHHHHHHRVVDASGFAKKEQLDKLDRKFESIEDLAKTVQDNFKFQFEMLEERLEEFVSCEDFDVHMDETIGPTLQMFDKDIKGLQKEVNKGDDEKIKILEDRFKPTLEDLLQQKITYVEHDLNSSLEAFKEEMNTRFEDVEEFKAQSVKQVTSLMQKKKAITDNIKGLMDDMIKVKF